nr:hypothetical protein [Tanacetum cinerariifolium]
MSKEIILISSNNNISSESNNFEQSISLDDIVSSNGLSKALLKWYDDATNEDIEEFMFSKSRGKKVQRLKKPTLTGEFGEFGPIKNCMLGLANVETWDCIVKRSFRADKVKGKRKNSSTRSQQAATRNSRKAIVNSPQPIYDQEPSMIAEDDEMSKDKEIDKLIALISLLFKKIYKPTNNNLLTSSNSSRANQDNSPRINRSAGIKIKGLNSEQADWRDETDDDELEDQELEAHYMYMAQLQEVSPDAADSGPIFDVEPLQNVSNDDHYNMFAMESVHHEQSKSVHDTYPIEQDAQNMIIDWI